MKKGEDHEMGSSWLPLPAWKILPMPSVRQPEAMKCWGRVMASGAARRKWVARS